MFLGGPPLVQAPRPVKIVTAEELGGCDMHTQRLRRVRLPGIERGRGDPDRPRDRGAMGQRLKKWRLPAASAVEAPLHDPEELYGILPDDIKKQFDMREVIARIVDGSRFHEYQPAYGTTLVCGYRQHLGLQGRHPRQQRHAVQRQLAQGRALHRAVQPERHAAAVPAEHHRLHGRARIRAAGITKDGAKMIMAQACSHVPKFTVMCHGSFGAGNYGMCGRAFDGRFLFTWPNHQIGVMGGEQAASTLAEVKLQPAEAQRRRR